MRVFTKIDALSFEQWKERRWTIMPWNKTIECPSCEGSGSDECSCCGHSIDCEKCEGMGTVQKNEIELKEYKVKVSEYQAEITEEIRNLSRCTNTDFFNNLCATKKLWSSLAACPLSDKL